jgi:hypothetical protein
MDSCVAIIAQRDQVFLRTVLRGSAGLAQAERQVFNQLRDISGALLLVKRKAV